MKTKENMAADLKNKIDDAMSDAGVYSQGIDGMIAASDFKNSLGEESEIDEKWSKKYKDSIDCKNPKGFSQKAHCQGKAKKTETGESTGSGSAGGFSAPLFSTTKKEMQENCWKGYKEVGGKKKNGKMVPNCVKEGKEEYCDGCDRVKSKCVCKERKDKKYLDIEDLIPELKKQLKKATQLDKDVKKIEATEATGSGSSGQYSTTAAWAKSTNKKDWLGKSKPQIPGGKFVQVKKKCKKFPYCNQGDIKALKIYENETVKKAIENISRKHNISENVIKSIISYEYEKLKSNK